MLIQLRGFKPPRVFPCLVRDTIIYPAKGHRKSQPMLVYAILTEPDDIAVGIQKEPNVDKI